MYFWSTWIATWLLQCLSLRGTLEQRQVSILYHLTKCIVRLLLCLSSIAGLTGEARRQALRDMGEGMNICILIHWKQCINVVVTNTRIVETSSNV